MFDISQDNSKREGEKASSSSGTNTQTYTHKDTTPMVDGNEKGKGPATTAVVPPPPPPPSYDPRDLDFYHLFPEELNSCVHPLGLGKLDDLLFNQVSNYDLLNTDSAGVVPSLQLPQHQQLQQQQQNLQLQLQQQEQLQQQMLLPVGTSNSAFQQGNPQQMLPMENQTAFLDPLLFMNTTTQGNTQNSGSSSVPMNQQQQQPPQFQNLGPFSSDMDLSSLTMSNASQQIGAVMGQQTQPLQNNFVGSIYNELAPAAELRDMGLSQQQPTLPAPISSSFPVEGQAQASLGASVPILTTHTDNLQTLPFYTQTLGPSPLQVGANVSYPTYTMGNSMSTNMATALPFEPNTVAPLTDFSFLEGMKPTFDPQAGISPNVTTIAPMPVTETDMEATATASTDEAAPLASQNNSASSSPSSIAVENSGETSRTNSFSSVQENQEEGTGALSGQHLQELYSKHLALKAETANKVWLSDEEIAQVVEEERSGATRSPSESETNDTTVIRKSPEDEALVRHITSQYLQYTQDNMRIEGNEMTCTSFKKRIQVQGQDQDVNMMENNGNTVVGESEGETSSGRNHAREEKGAFTLQEHPLKATCAPPMKLPSKSVVVAMGSGINQNHSCLDSIPAELRGPKGTIGPDFTIVKENGEIDFDALYGTKTEGPVFPLRDPFVRFSVERSRQFMPKLHGTPEYGKYLAVVAGTAAAVRGDSSVITPFKGADGCYIFPGWQREQNSEVVDIKKIHERRLKDYACRIVRKRGKANELPPIARASLCAAVEAGTSATFVSKAFEVSRASVYMTQDRRIDNNSDESGARCGRPEVFYLEDADFLNRMRLEHPEWSLKRTFDQIGGTISESTGKRLLQKLKDPSYKPKSRREVMERISRNKHRRGSRKGAAFAGVATAATKATVGNSSNNRIEGPTTYVTESLQGSSWEDQLVAPNSSQQDVIQRQLYQLSAPHTDDDSQYFQEAFSLVTTSLEVFL